MKNRDRLNFYGWPLLASIIILSLPVAIALLPWPRAWPAGFKPRAPQVKYKRLSALEAGEIAERRALYASDLFASSRGERLPAPCAALDPTNQFALAAVPAAAGLAPATPAGIGAAPQFDRDARAAVADADAALLIAARQKKSPPRKKPAQPILELKGALKSSGLASNLFTNLALSAAEKPWTFQAELGINAQGGVDYVMVVSSDCRAALQQELVQRLYQCRFGQVTQACAGAILISSPAGFPP